LKAGDHTGKHGMEIGGGNLTGKRTAGEKDFVSMNPYTGERLALVRTFSYNNDCFIMELLTEKWNAMRKI